MTKVTVTIPQEDVWIEGSQLLMSERMTKELLEKFGYREKFKNGEIWIGHMDIVLEMSDTSYQIFDEK